MSSGFSLLATGQTPQQMNQQNISITGAKMKQTLTMTTYCNLMEEIRMRHLTIKTISEDMKKKRFKYSLITGAETCYLQLRLICELIALGCLVAHNDIKATQSGKFPKEYSADRIIKLLGRLHSKFYPQPVTGGRDPKTRIIMFRPRETGYLTQKELLTLYNQCGTILHRGSLRNYLTNPGKLLSVEDIDAWADKIIKLLDRHLITLVKPGIKYVVLMKSADHGRVQMAQAERVPEQPSHALVTKIMK